MSSDGSIAIVWGDGENRFKFGIGQFRELQEKINERRVRIGAPLVGPMSLANLLRANDAWPDDVRDVLRIGLVGAGMPIAEANRKLSLYFDNQPILEHMLVALSVLLAGLVGPPGAEPENSDAKKKT